MSVNRNEAYNAEFHRALEKCQFVEETLKMCLLSAIDIARIQVEPFFPLAVKPQDISHLPLGPLVNAFAKIHADKALLDDLQALRKERNEVAHRSLLFTIGEMENAEHMSEQTAKMKAIADHAADLHSRVLDVRYALVKALNKAKRAQSQDDA